MESDGTEHFVDVESDDKSSCSESDDPREEETKEANEGDNEDATELEKATEFKSVHDLSASDIMSMEFDSHEKAYEFYVKYARCVGFSVWQDDVGHDVKGNISRRYYVCSRGIERQKTLYATTSCDNFNGSA